MIFFWDFLFRVGLERNETIIFIFSLFRPFPTCFDLKGSHNGIFLIFWTFLLFYWNFLLCVVEERNGPINFFFLFLCIFQPVLALNEVIMVYFNSFNFISIFLEFSISRWVGTERNDNFYFLLFSSFSNLFGLEKNT